MDTREEALRGNRFSVFCTRHGSAAILLLSLLVGSPAWADYFVYKANDGTIWYTDRKLPRDRYALLAKISTARPTVDCRNPASRSMEARARPYREAIRHYARLYGLDYRLLKALIATESCFDVRAVSRVGARGLMQLMPATADELGVQDAFDAEQNIRGGARYLRQMLDRFGQDKSLALAAYNAGPQAVERHQRRIPPYPETQQYVRRVLRHFQRYLTADSRVAAARR